MNFGGLRTSDADRAQVTTLLNTAYAEGRLSYDEHNERTAATLRSRTFDELMALTADLVPAESALVPIPTASPGPAAGLALTDQPDRVAVVLSSKKRVGPWQVARCTVAKVVLGDVLLDLTEAVISTDSVEVDCSQFMGSIKIRVPLGTNVRVEVTDVLAETTVKEIGVPDPAMPTVVVTGVNVLGEIAIRGPKKSLLWKRHVT